MSKDNVWVKKLGTIRCTSTYQRRRGCLPWAAQPRGVGGGQCTPTFEAKVVQGGTMKTIYVSQFRLYSGVRINISYMNQANGCYANSFFFVYFLYAYDNMLLSPSVLGLQSIHHSADVVFCFTPGLKSTYLFHKSYPPLRSFTSSSRTASTDLCLDRFFWATRCLILFFPYFSFLGRALD